MSELYYLRHSYYDVFFIPNDFSNWKELISKADEMLSREYPGDTKTISTYFFAKESSTHCMIIVVQNKFIPDIIRDSNGKKIVSGASVLYYEGSDHNIIINNSLGNLAYNEEFLFSNGELSGCRELQADDVPKDGSLRIAEGEILSTIATEQSVIDIDGSQKSKEKKKKNLLRTAISLSCIMIAFFTAISIARGSSEKRSVAEQNKQALEKEIKKKAIEKELLIKYIDQFGIGIQSTLAELSSLSSQDSAFRLDSFAFQGNSISFTAISGDPVLLTQAMERHGFFGNISLSVTDSSTAIANKGIQGKPNNSAGRFDIAAKLKNATSPRDDKQNGPTVLTDYQSRYWPISSSSPNDVLSVIITEFKAQNVEVSKYKAGEMGSNVVSVQSTLPAQKLYTIFSILENMRPSITISRCSVKRSGVGARQGDIDVDVDFGAYTSESAIMPTGSSRLTASDDSSISIQVGMLFGYEPAKTKKPTKKEPKIPSFFNELGRIVDDKGNTIMIYKNANTNEIINIKEKANAAN